VRSRGGQGRAQLVGAGSAQAACGGATSSRRPLGREGRRRGLVVWASARSRGGQGRGAARRGGQRASRGGGAASSQRPCCREGRRRGLVCAREGRRRGLSLAWGGALRGLLAGSPREGALVWRRWEAARVRRTLVCGGAARARSLREARGEGPWQAGDRCGADLVRIWEGWQSGGDQHGFLMGERSFPSPKA
jgi:hypothetical protein